MDTVVHSDVIHSLYEKLCAGDFFEELTLKTLAITAFVTIFSGAVHHPSTGIIYHFNKRLAAEPPELIMCSHSTCELNPTRLLITKKKKPHLHLQETVFE